MFVGRFGAGFLIAVSTMGPPMRIEMRKKHVHIYTL